MLGEKSNTIESLICRALIDWYISHDKFVLINIFIGKYYEIEEEIKNSECSVEYTK